MSVKAHLFVCIQARADGKACASNEAAGAQGLRDELKAECKKTWPGGEVRVNSAGCLGQCEKGIAAVLYPCGKWYFHLTDKDKPEILSDIASIIQTSKK